MKQKVNLIQIFNDIDDHFLKASESAHEVSKMLEATRMHYHSNFADNRGNLMCCFKFEWKTLIECFSVPKVQNVVIV